MKSEKEYKILPMGKYPASISVCNMEEDKQKEDTRFICNSCRKKYGCRHYGFAKKFIKENPNNDIKCEIYEKE